VRGHEIKVLLQRGHTGEAIQESREITARRGLWMLQQAQQRTRERSDFYAHRSLPIRWVLGREHLSSVEHVEQGMP
jgi:hypothetical protein